MTSATSGAIFTNKQLWFETSKFKPWLGEEDKTNPGRIGAALADWVREKLIVRGHSVSEDPISEDWGWLVMVQRKPYRLWVGCGNEDGSATRWSVFVEAEPSIFQKILKRIDPTSSVLTLEQDLEEIVRAESEFTEVEWESM